MLPVRLILMIGIAICALAILCVAVGIREPVIPLAAGPTVAMLGQACSKSSPHATRQTRSRISDAGTSLLGRTGTYQGIGSIHRTDYHAENGPKRGGRESVG